MWSWIVGILIDRVLKKIFELIGQAYNEYLLKKKLREKAKLQIKEAMSEKDPKERARRLTDLLNS